MCSFAHLEKPFNFSIQIQSKLGSYFCIEREKKRENKQGGRAGGERKSLAGSLLNAEPNARLRLIASRSQPELKSKRD